MWKIIKIRLMTVYKFHTGFSDLSPCFLLVFPILFLLFQGARKRWNNVSEAANLSLLNGNQNISVICGP